MISATGGSCMGFKRKQSRVLSGRIGRLQRGTLVVSCTVVDVSDSGVQLESRLVVKPGEIVQLLIECGKEETLTCEVEVVHVRAPKIGAKITSITPENQARFARMLDDDVQNAFTRH
ncbi:MAG: PilZ domain-containing protein [Nitrospira sp.]|nr:MAG: PilZ domain-containing protein [Nitrospira sp.]